ncbi:MAG: hypothetical protein ACYC09_01820 [Bacteroidota bacterium]
MKYIKTTPDIQLNKHRAPGVHFRDKNGDPRYKQEYSGIEEIKPRVYDAVIIPLLFSAVQF